PPGSPLFPYTTLFRSVVRPVVANVPQLTDDAPLGMPQRILEDGVPLIPKNAEQCLRIVEVDRLRFRPAAARTVLRQHSFPAVAQDRKSTRLNSSHVKI